MPDFYQELIINSMSLMGTIIVVCNNLQNSLYYWNTLEYERALKYFYSLCDKEYGDA